MDNTPNELMENLFQKMRNVLKKKEFIYIYVWTIRLAHEWKFCSKTCMGNFVSKDANIQTHVWKILF